MDELAQAERLLDHNLEPQELIKKLEQEQIDSRILVAVKRILQEKAIEESQKQEPQEPKAQETESQTGILKRNKEGEFQFVTEQQDLAKINPE